MADTRLNLIVDLVNRTEAGFKQINDNFKAMKDQTQTTEDTLKGIAVTSGIAFGALSLGIGKAASDYGAFNSEIQRVGAFVNASTAELKDFETAAINAAKGTKFSFIEAAQALGNFAGGEVDAKEAAQSLGGIIDLALVTKMDNLQEAVNLGSLALTAFKKDGMDMADVADIMATVAADVTTQTQSWSTALVNSAGAAKGAGFSFKDLNVVFAAMVRGGANVQTISTALTSALQNMQAPTKQAKEALEAYGLSASQLRHALQDGPITALEYLRQGFEKANKSGDGFVFLSQVLGRQAAPEFAAALNLTNEELQETVGWFDDAAGSSTEMLKRIKDSESPLQKMSESFAELSLSIGKAVTPALNALAAVIVPVISFVADMAAKFPGFTGFLLVGAAAVTGLIFAISTLGLVVISTSRSMGAMGISVANLSRAWTFLTTTTIASAEAMAFFRAALITTGIGAIVVGLGILIDSFLQLKDATGSFGNAFKAIWDTIKKIFADSVTWILDQLQSNPLFKFLIAEVQFLISVFNELKSAASALANFFRGIWSSIGQSFSDGINWIKENLKGLIDGLAQLKNAAMGLVSVFKGVWDKIGQTFSDSVGFIGGILQKIPFIGKDVSVDLTQSFRDMSANASADMDMIASSAAAMSDSSSSSIGDIGSSIETVKEQSNQWTEQVGADADQQKEYFNSLVDSVKGVRDDIVGVYNEMSAAAEDFIKNVMGEQSDFQGNAAQTVAKAQQGIADLKKQIKEAQSEGKDSQVDELTAKLQEQQDIVKSYEQSGLDLSTQISEERKKLNMNEFELIMFNHQKKLDLMSEEFVAEQDQRMQKLNALLAEHDVIMSLMDVETQKKLEAEITKQNGMRNRLTNEREGLRVFIADTTTMYQGYVTNLNKILSQVQSVKSPLSSLSSLVNITGKRAEGGPVMSGNAYLVGEKGPEIFSPGLTGQIIPMKSGVVPQGGSVINLYITGNSFIGRESIAEQISADIMKALNRNIKT